MAYDKITKVKQLALSLKQRLQNCDICPRNCQVDRLSGKVGYCGGGKDLAIYTAFLHCGEEPAISGDRGSGTIFFSGCNLKCIYCQNYEFSQLKKGKLTKSQALADIMLGLEKEGAHNINLVTPTHYLPQILDSLYLAIERGLKLPIVYNTSGYEEKTIISQLGGIVDVYLTDLRYLSSGLAQKYSNAENYPKFAMESIKEMHRQYPKPKWQGEILEQGLVIRLLALPGYIEELKNMLVWIKENAASALVSVMSQYQPYFKASKYPELNRPLNKAEYQELKAFTGSLDFEMGWIQDFQPQSSLAGVNFKPDFEKST